MLQQQSNRINYLQTLIDTNTTDISSKLDSGNLIKTGQMFVLGNSVGFYNNPQTSERCFCVKVVCAATTTKGAVLCYGQGGTARQVDICPISGNTQDMPVGIALSDGSAGSEIWMAATGIVQALPDLAITAAKGSVAYMGSTTAGRLAQTTGIGTAQHWRECGHWTENGSGNGVLALLITHFN
jgi:hypothetical protein